MGQVGSFGWMYSQLGPVWPRIEPDLLCRNAGTPGRVFPNLRGKLFLQNTQQQKGFVACRVYETKLCQRWLPL